MFMEQYMKPNNYEKNMNMAYKGYGITTSYKSLGVIIQRNQLFNLQAESIIQKTKKNMKLIHVLKKICANPEHRMLVWYSHV